MFEYFPGNYVWNLSVVATLNSGGLIDEVDRACRPVLEAAALGSDAGTGIFTEEEGGTEHISLDNLPVVGGYIADWIAETFSELAEEQHV